jgi:archaellum component FlaC
MDVERTMQFILDSQARAEVRMDRWEERANRADGRMDRMEERANLMEERFNRRLNGITKIIQTGMKMLVRLEKAQAELAEAQRELAASQKVTDRQLQAFLDSLRKGKNGR